MIQESVRTLADFFSFDALVGIHVLRILYFAGAVGIPLIGWIFARRIRARAPDAAAEAFSAFAGTMRRGVFLSFFIFFCFFIEILWRLLCEFLIAFLQMREALFELTGK